MEASFTSDEMILALVSLIRATNPSMLQQGPEGFTVDFEALDRKAVLTADERLMMKLRVALETTGAPPFPPLNLETAEAARLAETLQLLESLQSWPADVREMSDTLRARLTAAARS